jgi:hypothetical protein
MAHQGQLLFQRRSLHDALERKRRDVLELVNELDREVLLGEAEGAISRIIEDQKVAPLQLRPDEVTADEDEAQVSVRDDFDFGRRGHVRGTAVKYFVPFSGDEDLFDLTPNQFDTNPPRGEVEDGELVFTYLVPGTDVKRTKQEFDADLASTQRYIGWVNPMVDDHNAQLPGLVRQAVTQRQQRLAESRQGLEALGVPRRTR